MTSKRSEWLQSRGERYYLKIQLDLARIPQARACSTALFIIQGSKTILHRQASAQQLGGEPCQKRHIIGAVSNCQRKSAFVLWKKAVQGEPQFTS